MDYELTQNLSNDISNLRKDTSNCDVKIRVGKEPNIKEFKAHSLILSSRSIYFKKAFSAQWARKEDGFFISNQPNISPTVFEILINHIYSGTFSIENNESLVDVIIASDELELLEIYQQLEKHLLENESDWKFPKDFITLCQFRHDDHFSNLYQVAIDLVFSTQFNGILPKDLVDDVLQYFSDPNSKPLLKNLPLRVTVYPFDSKIINAKDAALISREIIGGYNPLEWRSIKLNGEDMPSNNSEFYNNHKCKTSDSFIFSLFSSTNGVIPTLSRVSSKKEAIIWCKDKGPCFGLQDLWIQSSSRSGRSKQKSYEKTIINKETFEIEEYEVYQIIDTRFSYYEFIKRIFNEEILYLNDRFFKLFENVYTTYIENRYVW
ncbi:uncharacterized protein OCT59_004474 [Rhizophagus irregularis]|uniref:uncharacterized protein n=1 Tax=Rhizophagus irregularis TaxID=588596 RepID=UPI0033193A7D|nr:hypothetical protein OCT59_004474 [Rhizophagus irregularis]